MGVYIKGFPLPNNCGNCPLRLAWCRERIYMVNRPDRCPLVPVPPHGRLGDLDALITTFCKWGTSLERKGTLVITMAEAKQTIVDIIEKATTIIQAEPQEEES